MSSSTPEAKTLGRAFEMFRKDLEALPDEAFDKKFGPKVRTVADFVHEVNLVNDHICLGIRGEEQFPWPEGGWIFAPEGQCSKADVLAGFEKSASGVTATADGLSPEDLSRPIQTEHGETTVAERLRFMGWHLGYHSGQLNYIQTLLGDDGWHW